MADKPTSPPPAYFLSLSLENVRSFGAKQTIYFTENGKENGRLAKWTIILGDNGVGKTTVLKSLAAIAIAPGEGEFPDDRFRDSNFTYQWLAKWWPTRNDGILTTRINFSAHVGNLNEQALSIYSSEDAIRINNIDDEMKESRYLCVESIPKELWELFCYGYGASRATGNSTLGQSNDTSVSLFNDRADLLDPQEWFLNIDYGIRLLADDKQKQLSDANNRVRQMLKDVLPGVTDLRIDNSGTPQKPQISLQFLLYGTWVRLRDMSLGYQTLTVWLTDLASKLYVRYPESNNPLAEPATVLIDEIDLHLHPQWQRELLGMLSKIFINTQFIATAHSPLVVQAAGDEGANVVLLRREGDQTVVVTDAEDIRGWRVDQILTSSFFNLETARSLETEKKLARQAKLLNKPKLTAKERQELEALTQELEGQPMGSTRPHAKEEEAELLRQITERLGTSLPNLNVGQ